jgi:hypothetical protein
MTRQFFSECSMKPVKSVVFPLVCSVLMFMVAACMFVHVANGGSEFQLDNGLRFAASQIGIALMMLTLMLIPFMFTAVVDAQKGTRLFKWAPIGTLAALLLFPVPFEITFWSPATYADGEPMYEDDGVTRVPSWDGSIGYIPLWSSPWVPERAYTRYETTDLGSRLQHEGNRWWGTLSKYELNTHDAPVIVYDDTPFTIKECLGDVTHHLLGFHWSDPAMNSLAYDPWKTLPPGRCTDIAPPAIGSELQPG